MTKRDDDALRDRLDRLPRDLPPARDLWPEIAERIQEASPRARTQRRAAAAAASSLALAAAAALVMGLRRAPTVPYPAPVVATEQPSAAAPSALPEEKDYEGAERTLATELAERRTTLSSSEATVIDDNLRIVDDAITSTREALQADPEDTELRSELDRAWEDKLALLQQATELPPER
jgi:hypothetical protein